MRRILRATWGSLKACRIVMRKFKLFFPSQFSFVKTNALFLVSFLLLGGCLDLALAGQGPTGTSAHPLLASHKGAPSALCELLLSRRPQLNDSEVIEKLSSHMGQWQDLPVFEMITARENRRLMRFVESHSGEEAVVFTGEIAVLKELNDSYYKDKDLVTKIVDLHKHLFVEEMLSGKYEKIESTLSLAYSDFKTLRFVFSRDSMELHHELTQLLTETNDRFHRLLSGAGLLEQGESRRGLIRHPQLWFLAGIGSTADESGFAARAARSVSAPDELQVVAYKNVKGELEKLVKVTEDTRQKLVTKFLKTAPNLLKKIPDTDQWGFDFFVIHVLLKTKVKPRSMKGLDQQGVKQLRAEQFVEYIEAVRSRLEKVYRLPEGTISFDDVAQLKLYISGLDQVMPGIFIEKRVILDLNRAHHAVVSMDFAGLNVWNFEQTAWALVRSQGQPVEEVLLEIRQGERQATHILEERKEVVAEVFDQVMGTSTYFSGDDGMAFPETLSESQKRAMVRKLTETESADAFRLTFVDKVVGNVEAELIEKDLRMALESSLTLEEQAQLTLAIDLSQFHSDEIISLWAGGLSGHSPLRSRIEQALHQVLENRGYSKEQIGRSVVHPVSISKPLVSDQQVKSGAA